MKKQFTRFTNFWNSPYGPVSITSFVLAILSVFLPNISIITFCLLLIAACPWLLPFIEEMELPGGIKIKTNDLINFSEKAREAGLLKDVEPNKQLLYLKIYEEDPNLALAGLRIEIEKRLLKLAELAEITVGPTVQFSRPMPIRQLYQELHNKGHLTNSETSLLADLMPTLNQAVHGKKVTKDASDWVVTDGSKILAALDDKIKDLEALKKPS